MHTGVHMFERLVPVEGALVPRLGTASARVTRSQPLIGLIHNPRSHRNEHGAKVPQRPIERDGIIVAMPGRRRELPGILADFALRGVDCIAIDGGDGTVRDVLTSGAGVFGDSWPDLILLPSGKTNALAYDLGIPAGWTLEQALRAIARGRTVARAPLVVSSRADPRAQVHGFVLGAGAFTRAVTLGQKSHAVGAYDSAVVVLTAAWALMQALFGSSGNAWRRGSGMVVREAAGGPLLPHCGGLPANERYVLLASTLDRFPGGVNPFRGLASGLRIGVLDSAARSLLLRIPLIARGHVSAATRARGFHAWRSEAVDLDLAEPFILDGEAFPAGQYRIAPGAGLRFIVP